jgi:hypothetical protein
MDVSTRTQSAFDVAIVSANAETLDGLRSYLHAAGVGVRALDDVGSCTHSAADSTRAFIIFPDDFRWESVVAAMADLDASRPDVLPVLVTAQPNRFRDLIDRNRVLVVPRPAWGWIILDAIRAHVNGGILER